MTCYSSKPTIDRERILKSHGIDSELVIREGESRWKHGRNTGQLGKVGEERSLRFMTRNNPRGEERRLWNTALCERIGALTQISHRRQERKRERELAGSNPPGRRTQFINVPSITTQRLKTLDTEQTSWCLARTNTWHFTLQLPRMPARTACASVGDKREKLECYSTLVGCPRKALLSFHGDLFSRGSSSPLHELPAFRFVTQHHASCYSPSRLLILFALNPLSFFGVSLYIYMWKDENVDVDVRGKMCESVRFKKRFKASKGDLGIAWQQVGGRSDSLEYSAATGLRGLHCDVSISPWNRNRRPWGEINACLRYTCCVYVNCYA